MADADPRLLRRGLALEYCTLGWNVVGVAVLTVAAITAGSVALAGFALDSAIEIFASTVVIWELADTGKIARQRRGLRLIGAAFFALAIYIIIQAVATLTSGHRPSSSTPGIVWTALTCAAMLALATGKTITGKQLDNPVLATEAKVTFVDAFLAAAVLVGLTLNATAGWWWADPAAGLVIVVYGIKEGREAWTHASLLGGATT